MDTGGEEGCVTILCPRQIAAFSAEPGLYWLIGSPRFLPPITVVSALRCLHLHDSDHYSPEYPSESDALRSFLIRGFNVIGALCVGDGEREENAQRAIDYTLLLKKHLAVDEDGAGFDVVGAAADLISKEIHFFGFESTGGSSSLKRLHSVVHHEGNPEKVLWESGCLLRCQLEFRLPIYVPEGKISDAENMLTSVTDDVITKLRDPQVAFLVEGTHTTNPPILLRGAEMNCDSQSPVNSAEVMEKVALPCSHFALMQKGLIAYNVRENAGIIRVTVLSNRSADEQSCFAPIAQFLPATLSPRLIVSSFKLDVLCYSSKDFPISSSISRLMVPGLIDQLTALRKSIGPKVLLQPQLCPYHFFPPGILHPVTAIYELSYGETEMVQVEIRRSLHLRMGLPLDRPLLRVANSLTFGSVGNCNPSKAGSLIKDVHVDIPRSGVSGGISSLIDGSYEYYHYLQDGLDDNGWGCAYRSLQTIISWFGLQHYTSLKVPSHREIQQTLVEIGDKDPSFVGSRDWIGAIELSFVLDKLLGVSCKIINVRSGAELPEKCRELALHFKNQGTPVMIGGGVLAYTLLGVDYNDASGDCAFLILDPHYTGGDDQKKIVSGGWCGWKKPVDSKGRNFFMHDKFYNLLLPQRPNMV